MSDGKGDEAYNISCCASCGIAEIDDVKLKDCDACDLVRYCSDECQRDHISCHSLPCKKRAAELRDEILFKQPESTHLGDCPICCLPLPLDIEQCNTKTVRYSCCSKTLCTGCYYGDAMQQPDVLQRRCPFCRSGEESDRYRMKRLEANDPVALRDEGLKQYNGGDYRSAFQWYTKAAQLGDVDAHYQLSILYAEGLGVEKDREKEIYHREEAAICGHFAARHNLGCDEYNNNRNAERAAKHFIIASAQGNDGSIKLLMELFKRGDVEKDILAAALRAHQAAVDATKSSQREAGEEYIRNLFNA